jgi:hypothetical protein
MKKAIAMPLGQGTEYIELTADEIAQREAEENAPPPPLPLVQQLDVVFSSLPLETQADFAPLKAAVKLELDQEHIEIASLIIQRATIPEELEAVRQNLLDILASVSTP